jgi:hypothetical protein
MHTNGKRRLIARTLAVALFIATGTASAQTAPSSSEVARYTGLLAAAHNGQASRINQLVAAGATVDASDGNGRTPLHVATFAGQREAIRALVKAGADTGRLDNDRYDAITIAAVADDEASLSTLLALGASAALVTSRYDGTALIAAAHLGHAGIVRQLIAAGAPLDHINNLHWTAVIESITLGDGGPRHRETLAALISAGANLQIADRRGNTPLALARSRGYREMESMLLTAGAR